MTNHNDATIKDLMARVHQTAKEKGWWETARDWPTLIALMHSELSEALEEYRKDTHIKLGYRFTRTSHTDEGLPQTKLEGLGVELADCVIRIMDACVYYGIDLEACILEKMQYNSTRSYRHGGLNT